jgi:hypothetical protein
MMQSKAEMEAGKMPIGEKVAMWLIVIIVAYLFIAR